MRCDVAIIGANADGLAAAVPLGRSGLKTIVVDQIAEYGGLASTREFHSGFRASAFLDELPQIPAEIFWALDLARKGTIFVPSPPAVALWPGGRQIPENGARPKPGTLSLFARGASLARGALTRAAEEGAARPRHIFEFRRRAPSAKWPGEEWSRSSMAEILTQTIGDPEEAALAAAIALTGRSADPFLSGSALHLIAGASGGVVMGGLKKLTEALALSATEAGVEILHGIEAGDILLAKGSLAGLALSDGSELEARAVISTLDLKRTFLSHFPWRVLPGAVIARVNAFRMAGATARVLLALDRMPENLPVAIAGSTIHVAPDLEQIAKANQTWRMGVIPDAPPVALRFVSVADPRLAPTGGAVLTITLGAIAFRLFDGAWTREKRDLLRDRALAAADSVLPGVSARAVAVHVITPSDMEVALGATEGDLWGGEIAPDQMFGFRPWINHCGPRTPMSGLYLAGPSSAAGPLATCASGWQAAQALLADCAQRRLR